MQVPTNIESRDTKLDSAWRPNADLTGLRPARSTRLELIISYSCRRSVRPSLFGAEPNKSTVNIHI